MRRDAERVMREIVMAGASGRRDWTAEAAKARKRRAFAMLARDILLAVVVVAVFVLFFWAAAHGLDSEAELWAVGDYGEPEEVEP